MEGMVFGNTGLCSLEINRNAKGDHSYCLKTYFSAKGTAPDAGVARADKLRLEVERRLGLLDGPVITEEARASAVRGRAFLSAIMSSVKRDDLVELLEATQVMESEETIEAAIKKTVEIEAALAAEAEAALQKLKVAEKRSLERVRKRQEKRNRDERDREEKVRAAAQKRKNNE